ncbi:MAG: response regulator transcription factor [Sphingomonadaceae bacterium]|nr:response regulator transcription factor [Sphingomonadaceae bacterium]
MRLLLIDDHPLFVDGFATMVAAARGWHCAAAHSATEGCARLADGFDLALVDLELPDRDGFATLADLAAIDPALPRIVISGRADAAARMRVRAAGASGFIVKSLPPAQMLAIIDDVAAGRCGFGETATAVPSLSPRQLDVLALLAEGHANKEIRFRLGIAERTVRAHLTELFAALGVSTRVNAILRAREIGLIR